MTWAEKVEYIFNRRKPQKLEQMSEMVNDSMEFVGADDEKMEYTVEIKIQKWMENPRNELHGGVCCTFFDTTTALASIALAGEKTVATAAPATPQSKTRMQNKSSRIFRTVEKSRNQNGVLLSPKARIMLDNKL